MERKREVEGKRFLGAKAGRGGEKVATKKKKKGKNSGISPKKEGGEGGNRSHFPL